MNNPIISSNVADLSVSRLDYLYNLDQKEFGNNTFWSLWKNVSTLNKIKLFDFFISKNLPFDKRRALRELVNHSRRDLSPSEWLRFIELFLEVERDPEYARDMLRDFHKSFMGGRHEKYSRRDLSPSEWLRFIELFLEVGRDPEYARDMLREIPKYLEYGNGYLSKKLAYLMQKI